MSLRTKLMLSICAFMVLVFGLLTLNLWLDAAARSRLEAQRNADLVARLVGDLARAWTARFPEWSEDAAAELSRRLELTAVVDRWAVVAFRDGRPAVVATNETGPARETVDLAPVREALAGVRVERQGTRVYLPLDTGQGERFVVRLDLSETALPAADFGAVFRGIASVMVLGTALLLLNVFVVTDRLVLRPLGSLVDAAGRVAAGDFSRKIPAGAAYDEMGRLAAAFNLMLDRISIQQRALEADVREARGRITRTERRLAAVQRLSTTGTLAAGIAHEINNPLGGMINAVRALRDGRLDDAKRAEYLELVADGLDRVRAIVQRLLQFGPRSTEPRPVDLRTAVDQALAFLQHRLSAKDVSVQNELPSGLPPVNGDPLELQQAFLNVLLNAVDATVIGEGVVTIYHRLEEGVVRVMVADNGCGMDPEEQSRCLDPFFTTKDVGEGTGLGLAVAHSIVTGHGGKLDIRSGRGEGTTVTFTFPTAPATAAAG
ncbi:MAG TPA: ATP-binding protein [Planctomycetota bacterium]|nr:ATP-binding protein [Planctomycetota bacterium]